MGARGVAAEEEDENVKRAKVVNIQSRKASFAVAIQASDGGIAFWVRKRYLSATRSDALAAEKTVG